MDDRRRSPTSTSNFGVGKRESHDATGFYDRFRAPDVSTDSTVLPPKPIAEPVVVGDSRFMTTIEDGSVALVVTSPPYFAGKQYEEELEREGVPASYLDYLTMLTEVFAECVRKLEPGGRICVNVANLGRKPYRSLSADVIRILEHDLGLLLRGELIWQKGEGATGSCAWGSFRSASNPVLRDITERVIIASKGRFDRARTVKQRTKEGLPSENTLATEDFMAMTLDLWSIPPESARRVGHPAPFPVALPEQLIRLYTYVDDLVLDPFVGSGSALVAAAMLGRRYIGYDLDPAYVAISKQRVAEALAAGPRSEREPQAVSKMAEARLIEAGFAITRTDALVRKTGVAVTFAATDAHGATWHFDVAGPNTTLGGGMSRIDVVWRALGRAHALRGRSSAPLVLLTTDLPRSKSKGDTALRAAGPHAVFDVIALGDVAALARMTTYASGGPAGGPTAGFWTDRDLIPTL